MKILGRDIALARIPAVMKGLMMGVLRAVQTFERPASVLRCYLTKRPPQTGLLRFRGGGTVALSSYHEDIVTVFVVFCKQEYGVDFAGKTVLDIGANIGAFALLACRQGCRSLVAVEPSPEAFGVLCQNLADNGLGGRAVSVHAAVCGHERGLVPFPAASSARNSLTDTSADQPLAQVPTTTLGALLEQHFGGQLDLLKMDCEGAEVEIVSQASDQDLRRIREIRMEFHGPDIEPTLARLHRLGFRTVFFERAGPVTAQVWLRLGYAAEGDI